ncbi:MAG: phosphatase PAP2 family protein [Anaerolineales bacterium]|nr:phosphatase PAP2 family protein [Anaerolineales bacterium]MCX7755777.1 phosphatase PAP2 family protein [Anaerolineales bacterium]MDW8279035.1 phosphatase PAP2 family protein [Anaerolineales bacterium]
MLKRLLELDRDWSYALRVAEKPGLLRRFAMFFAHSGDSWFWGLGMILLWLAADVFWKRWAVYELWWISVLAALVMALKFLIKRRRPEGEWGAIYRNTDPHSFPSGHAARAFLIAVLATLLGPNWLAALLWLWAPLVALARVAMGVHYLSDIIAGAVVGILVALGGYSLSPAIFERISEWMRPFWGGGLW